MSMYSRSQIIVINIIWYLLATPIALLFADLLTSNFNITRISAIFWGFFPFALPHLLALIWSGIENATSTSEIRFSLLRHGPSILLIVILPYTVFRALNGAMIPLSVICINVLLIILVAIITLTVKQPSSVQRRWKVVEPGESAELPPSSLDKLQPDKVDSTAREGDAAIIKCCIWFVPEDLSIGKTLLTHIRATISMDYSRIWDPTQISPGIDRMTSITERITSADIIILLVSAAFLASQESKRMTEISLQLAKDGVAEVIPVLARPCSWNLSAIGSLHLLPSNHRAISRHRDKEAAVAEVASQIASIITSRRGQNRDSRQIHK